MLLGLILGVPRAVHSASARPVFVVTGPAEVAVGHRFSVTLRLQGSPGVTAYETQLLFDPKAAQLSAVTNRGNALSRLGWEVHDLGALELGNGAVFGSYACATVRCGPAGAPPDDGATGDVALATVTLIAEQAGRLDLRFAGLRLASGRGVPINAVGGNQIVRVNVMGAGPVDHPAPGLGPLGPRGLGPAKVVDATEDGRLTEADVREASLAWMVTHADRAYCHGTPFRATDVNNDGCVDVTDVQSVVAAVGRQSKLLRKTQSAHGPAAAAANPVLIVNSVGDQGDAFPGNGVCATSVGTCTLRAAITEANAEPGANTINLAIAGTGVHTIQLASALPALSDTTGGTLIDGYTQPGAVANASQFADDAQIEIEIRGTGPSGIDGLMITSADNTLSGLAFYNLRRPLFMWENGALRNSVRGCFVGTNAGGTFGHTVTDTYASGIAIEGGAANNNVGDTSLAGRNVVSGNARHGIVTYNEGSNNNIIVNNIIGLSPLGDRRIPNLKHGIDINAGSSFNLVGRTVAGARNVISGNGVLGSGDSAGDAGLELSHATTTTGNQVVGNYFGTDVTGASAPSYTANAFWGIHVEDGVNHTLISDNIIVNSANGGIEIQDPGTSQNQVTKNTFGLTATGQPGRNEVYSVFLSKSATNNIIGPGNVLTNSPVGVRISDPGTDANTITQNSTYKNDWLGIDLDPFFQVNANDPGDVDTGSNQQLNFPVIASATPSFISGSACSGCLVEVFVADSNGPGTSGGPGAGSNGEGKTYLGRATANAGGDFSFPSQRSASDSG